MASERDEVRESVADKEHSDGDLQNTLSNAQQLQHTLDRDKEANRHKEAKIDKVIGAAPVVVAGIVVVLGFIAFFASMVAESWYAQQAEFWAKQGERGLGVIGVALGYIFGKGTSK